MKPTFATLIVLALTAKNLAAGDPMIMIKDKAKGVANQNNAQQGIPPSYGNAAPATPAAAPAPPPLTPQQQALVRLITALGNVKPDQSDQLAGSLMRLAQGKKPSWPAVHKLAKDLTAALAGKTFTGTPRSRVAMDLQAVLNGANLPPAQMEAVITDVPAILKKAGAAASVATAIGENLKAIVAEFHPAH